jgi:hypothetical protein
LTERCTKANWWRSARFSAAKFAALPQKTLWSSRAAKRYFGDEDISHFFAKHQERAVMQAYAGRGVLHYRATKSGQTHAEKLLAQGLPEAQAMLLRTRIAPYCLGLLSALPYSPAASKSRLTAA